MNIITVNDVNGQIANSMHMFGKAFLVAALVSAAVTVAAALSREKRDAVHVTQKIFVNCLIYALVLFGLAWLIS